MVLIVIDRLTVALILEVELIELNFLKSIPGTIKHKNAILKNEIIIRARYDLRRGRPKPSNTLT